ASASPAPTATTGSPPAAAPAHSRSRAAISSRSRWLSNSCGALAHDQARRQVHARHRLERSIRHFDDEPGGLLGHAAKRLPHRRQARAHPLGQRNVVVADEGEIFWHAQAELADGLEHAESLQVAAGEDGGGSVIAREEAARVL